ncbi:U-box domain-containing protein 7 [Abrus precatorius]|uniref:U-box domain-containing protein 7 n=1 Tax=Abrus precatorius TaxID=3816 RepID=A0A8B8JKL6_ABRPR|nr:U-box domain-containing protein 7 [Abrus precatorius]XP_027331800.1 U-box domain-containing protein 7 [Abrus precatorius]XP_027331801.1 U-box domain-containing protein 7 [Abrus precatorius]
MANCHRNNVGNLVLGHHPTKNETVAGHFRLWNSLSASSLRRLIFDAVSCGASSRYHHRRHQDDDDDESTAISDASEEKRQQHKAKANARSEKLSDLLNMAEIEADAETKKKEEKLEELKRVVKELQEEEDLTKRREAAATVRLVAKEDLDVRGTLAMLGAIPPLVSMLDSQEPDSLVASLYALLNLGIGNDANKAAIVKVGSVEKMLKLIESPDDVNSSVSEAIVANFLGLSALDSNKPIIGSSAAIPFLVRTLQSLDNKSSSQAKQDALRALYNLSIFPANISFILETNLVPFLINSVGDMEVTERNLAILSNLVSTREGRKAISAVPDAFPILVDVLNWTDSSECQEKASYILMVMAHKSYGNKQAMIEAGIVSSLLELSLLGTTLAQKRASRILEILRVDKGKQVSGSYGGNLVATVSAPICGSSSSCAKLDGGGKECSEEEEDMMSEEKKAVKQLVQQSLQNNMRKIVKRANLPQDIVPSDHFKSLTSSSTSKSLPF